MDDWQAIREGLTIQVEHILMAIPSGDVLITDCPKCGTRYQHIVGQAGTVQPIVDFIIGLMDDYQVKYIEVCRKYVMADTIKRMKNGALGQILEGVCKEGT